jgi:hypothetical protein
MKKSYNVGKQNPMFGKKRPEHSEKMKGEKNPFYGKKHSEENLKKISRFAGGCYDYWHSKARKYFFTGYCEICGKTNKDEIKENGKSLSMHNTLVPKDYTVMNINAWMCVCQSCHMIIERKIQYGD